MLKFLLITFLIGWLIFTLLGSVVKYVLRGGQPTSQQRGNTTQNHQRYNGKRPSDGNVNIDYVPRKDKRSKEDFKGGEYVDYEEVK